MPSATSAWPNSTSPVLSLTESSARATRRGALGGAVIGPPRRKRFEPRPGLAGTVDLYRWKTAKSNHRGGASLDNHPRNPCSDTGEEFIGQRPGPDCDLLDRKPLSKEDGFISDRGFARVHGDEVHRDPPDHRHPPTAEQDLPPVAERPRHTIGIADRKRRDALWCRGAPGRPVAHRVTLSHIAHLDDARHEGHDRAQRERPPSGPSAGLHSIEHETGPNRVRFRQFFGQEIACGEPSGVRDVD